MSAAERVNQRGRVKLERRALSSHTGFRMSPQSAVFKRGSELVPAYHLRHDLAPAKRPPKVERLLADTARNRWLAAGKLGHVRWRADLRQERDAGRIELFEAAMPLADIA